VSNRKQLVSKISDKDAHVLHILELPGFAWFSLVFLVSFIKAITSESEMKNDSNCNNLSNY